MGLAAYAYGWDCYDGESIKSADSLPIVTAPRLKFFSWMPELSAMLFSRNAAETFEPGSKLGVVIIISAIELFLLFISDDE